MTLPWLCNYLWCPHFWSWAVTFYKLELFKIVGQLVSLQAVMMCLKDRCFELLTKSQFTCLAVETVQRGRDREREHLWYMCLKSYCHLYSTVHVCCYFTRQVLTLSCHSGPPELTLWICHGEGDFVHMQYEFPVVGNSCTWFTCISLAKVSHF